MMLFFIHLFRREEYHREQKTECVKLFDREMYYGENVKNE